MDVAYVDTSFLVAILFDETQSKAATKRLASFDEIFSSNLLEAELTATSAREKIELPHDWQSAISWVLPDRALTEEIATVIDAGYVRGADLWHLASALFLAGDAPAISFLTFDDRQKRVAEVLGFKV
jgi:predicted nucleic acid-binding protein